MYKPAPCDSEGQLNENEGEKVKGKSYSDG